MISWLVAEIYFEQPHLGLTSLVVMSINLSCKHAKRVSGLSTLADALDAAMLDCLHAGRPSLDIVCGNINMARPPLSLFYKCPSRASAAPAASSRAAAPRCSSAPLLLCAIACCVVPPSLFFAVPHSLGWSESSPQLWKDATYDVFESRGILPVSDWSQ
jgi:hypothetical protein